VGDVIYLRQVGSPATLHRRLSKLAQADFIRFSSDVDGRKKYLELTPKSIDYFTKLGECIKVAASKAGA
jgi:DNA-binding MarR family transcriptional regulator